MDVAPKHHRLLTDPEMLSILESTEEELSLAEARLGELAGEIFDGIYEPGLFAHLVKCGAFTASTVSLQGEAKFILIHSKTALGWLTVEGIASIKRCPMQAIFDAVDELARRLNCRVIQFVTKLAALQRFAQGRGYRTSGIILHKNALSLT